MTMEHLMEQLRSLVPEENFKRQPETAKQKIIDLEQHYKVNTSSMLRGVKKEYIPEEIIDIWINEYQTFKNFGGEINELNHISNNYIDSYYISDSESTLNLEKEYDETSYESFFTKRVELVKQIEQFEKESIKDSFYFLLYLKFPFHI